MLVNIKLHNHCGLFMHNTTHTYLAMILITLHNMDLDLDVVLVYLPTDQHCRAFGQRHGFAKTNTPVHCARSSYVSLVYK